MKKKKKSVTELTKGIEKFLKGKELNPNNKEDFERIIVGKKSKPRRIKK